MLDSKTLGLPWDWPERDESARSLLQRIAIMNGMSPDELVERYIGVTQGAIARSNPESLQTFADKICCPLEILTENSPVEIPSEVRRYKNEKVALIANRKLRGVVLSGNFIGGENRRRICPDCFRQSAHHRFWWEVLPITTCPNHGLTLATGCRCGATTTLRWTDPTFFCCRTCGSDDLDSLNSMPAAEDVMAVDRYLLGRFGVIEARPVPLLDEGTFYDAIDTMERIGAASIAGYQKRWQSAGTLKRPVQEVRAVGFEILANGRLPNLLDSLLASYRKTVENHIEPALTSAYGWLFHWLNMKAPKDNAPLLLEEFRRHADANFYLNGRARRTYPGAPDDGLPPTYSLGDAADLCGIRRETLRNMWVSMGMLRKQAFTGRVLVFDGPTIRQMAQDIATGLTLDETAARLGVDVTTLRAMLRASMVKPALYGGGEKHAYVFRPAEVDALMARILGDAPFVKKTAQMIDSFEARRGPRLPAVAFYQLILDGKLKVVGRLKAQPGIRGALVDRGALRDAITELCKTEDVGPGLAGFALQVHSQTIAHLVSRRVLNVRVKDGATLITAKSIQKWLAKFISLQEIANRLDCKVEAATRKLDRTEVWPVKKIVLCGLVAYDRHEVLGKLEKIRACYSGRLDRA